MGDPSGAGAKPPTARDDEACGMTVFMIPELEGKKSMWPSLGPQVCNWIEENLVHGPGDIRGNPAKLDDEKRALIARMYEVYGKDHPQAGRRRFKRCALSVRKGWAKTELAAWIAIAELHPQAPVRTVGWRGKTPIGGPVTDPYIPLIAATEEQSEELAYGALRVIITEAGMDDVFDIGLERVMRRGGDGKAVALAGAPNARDGARTTFQVVDESHRLVLPRVKAAHQTMLMNIAKRRAADAWTLEITTAPSPGEGSIAEDTMEYARAVHEGRVKDARLFFFHREASDKHDITTDAGARAAVLEASGPVASWSDIEAIIDAWRDPTTDRPYWERVWLNRLVRSSARAFDAERWKQIKRDHLPKDGALITLGFDGARTRDATALIATEVETGFQWPLGIWERPLNIAGDWEVPVEDVDRAVALAFTRYHVWRLYADPPNWATQIAAWAGRYGEDRVVEWWTNREKATAYAVRNYRQAIERGEVTHDGDPHFARHIGNAVRRPSLLRDEFDQPLFLIQKERPDSVHKIDAAMAAVLSWEARNDAIAAGAQPPKKRAWGVAG